MSHEGPSKPAHEIERKLVRLELPGGSCEYTLFREHGTEYTNLSEITLISPNGELISLLPLLNRDVTIIFGRRAGIRKNREGGRDIHLERLTTNIDVGALLHELLHLVQHENPFLHELMEVQEHFGFFVNQNPPTPVSSYFSLFQPFAEAIPEIGQQLDALREKMDIVYQQTDEADDGLRFYYRLQEYRDHETAKNKRVDRQKTILAYLNEPSTYWSGSDTKTVQAARRFIEDALTYDNLLDHLEAPFHNKRLRINWEKACVEFLHTNKKGEVSMARAGVAGIWKDMREYQRRRAIEEEKEAALEAVLRTKPRLTRERQMIGGEGVDKNEDVASPSTITFAGVSDTLSRIIERDANRRVFRLMQRLRDVYGIKIDDEERNVRYFLLTWALGTYDATTPEFKSRLGRIPRVLGAPPRP